MTDLNENFGEGDPALARLCILAKQGDNDAMTQLEERAKQGDEDALNLMKFANMPSNPQAATEFVERNRDMLIKLLSKYNLNS